MASNKDFIKSIVAINPEAKTDGLNNNQLSELLKSLKTEVVEPEVVEPEVVEPEVVAAPYSVAEGKAITSRRGILANGAEITVKDLAGGLAALEHFVKTGHVVKA